MLGNQNGDWVSERRVAARTRILDAGWQLVREKGLAGLSLRDLAGRLGLAPASLYSYFPSKDAIYDAMFAQGYRAFLELDRPRGADLAEELTLRGRDFMRFCLEDSARYQLLFQRTIPGFEPSAESWALAQAAYDASHAGLIEYGLTKRDLDLVTAVKTGLVDQQISNDPGGTRWVSLIDDAAAMLHTHFSRQPGSNPTRLRRQRPQPAKGR